MKMKKIEYFITIIILFTSFIICRELEIEFISETQWLHGHAWEGGTSFSYNSIAIGSGFAGELCGNFQRRWILFCPACHLSA